jgi:hypothetical protein
MISFNAPQAPNPDKKNGWFAGFSSGWEQLAEVADDRNKKTALAQQQQQIALEARSLALREKQTNLQFRLGVMSQNLESKKLNIMTKSSDQNFNLESKKVNLYERMQQFEMGNTMREIANEEAGAKAASQFTASLSSLIQDRNITSNRVPVNQPPERQKTGFTTAATALVGK